MSALSVALHPDLGHLRPSPHRIVTGAGFSVSPHTQRSHRDGAEAAPFSLRFVILRQPAADRASARARSRRGTRRPHRDPRIDRVDRRGTIAPAEKLAICSTLDRGRGGPGPAWPGKVEKAMSDPIATDLCVIGARLRRPRGRRRRGADGRRGGAGREGQDGRRLPELRLRAVEVADRRRQGRADDPHRGPLRGQRPRAGDRLRGGARARPWRDRGDRAARFARSASRGSASGCCARRRASPGRSEIEVAGQRVRARRFVIATGSSPAVPPMPGLAEAPHLTNETIFELTERPEHLIVLGGGPIGCELAQAHRRLGARTTRARSGARSCPRTIRRRSRSCAGSCWPRASTCASTPRSTGVEREGNGVAVTVRQADVEERIVGSHLLVAAGRRRQRRGPRPRGRGHRLRPKGHRGRCAAAHQQPADLRDRRRRGRLPVHPHGRLSRRHRDPERAVPAAGQGRHPGGALGHLYRARARPGRPDRGDGQGAGRRGRGR